LRGILSGSAEDEVFSRRAKHEPQLDGRHTEAGVRGWVFMYLEAPGAYTFDT
jgi:hypothetical protein